MPGSRVQVQPRAFPARGRVRTAVRSSGRGRFAEGNQEIRPPEPGHEEQTQEAHLRKRSSFLRFSSCLSGACLGKMIGFKMKWHKKAVFAHGLADREQRLEADDVHERVESEGYMKHRPPFCSSLPYYV